MIRVTNSEMDNGNPAPIATIVRPTGSTVLFLIVAVVCGLGVASIVVGDFTLRGLAVAGIPIAVILVVYALYRFPCVQLRPRELVLVNPMTTVAIPWNLVDGFDTHFGLSVRTHEGSYSSWSLAGRGKKMEKDEDGIRRLRDNHSPAVDAVLDHHAGLGEDALANPRGERRVTVTWNVGVISAVIGAVAWAVIGVAALPG